MSGTYDNSFHAPTSLGFRIAGVEQVTIQDGAILPTTDDDINLGSATKEFKDAHFDGTVNIDTLAAAYATVTTLGVTDAALSSATVGGKGVLAVDTTSGRVLRRIQLVIDDATDINELKCTVSSNFNGDTIAETDNIGKNETVGDFSLDALGKILTIEASGLTGNCVAVIAAEVWNNDSTTALDIRAYADTNDIKLIYYGSGDGAGKDLTSLVDTGFIYSYITYITDA